ncbi:hypothetical protein Trydic_g13921 [Trypoxylus dichotomus]
MAPCSKPHDILIFSEMRLPNITCLPRKYDSISVTADDCNRQNLKHATRYHSVIVVSKALLKARRIKSVMSPISLTWSISFTMCDNTVVQLFANKTSRQNVDAVDELMQLVNLTTKL